MLSDLVAFDNVVQTTFMPIIHNFMQFDIAGEDDMDTLGLHHLMVQQPSSKGNSTDGRRGPPRRYRGKGKKMWCKGKRDMTSECINSWYSKLDDNNEKEWAMTLKSTFWILAYLAWFGPLLIPASWWMGWIILFFP